MQVNKNNTAFSSDVAPIFDKQLLGVIQRQIDPEKWDRVGELFEKKKYKEVLLGILDYVDSDLPRRTGNAELTKFVIPHGSTILELVIDEEFFHVTAPFLIIPPSHSVPLLRQIAQINIFPLNLTNIVLENDQLVFKFDCPLELCEPYKIYNVLREICSYADAYDEEFIKKFKAHRYHQPVIKPLPQKYVDLAWQKMQSYVKETAAYVDYFEKKRLVEVCVDLITITLMKIDYVISPQGILRTDIEKTVSQLQDQEIPLMEKPRKGMERIVALQNFDQQEFALNLYEAEVFIPLKFNFTNEMIDSYFQIFFEAAQKEMAGRDYVGVVLTVQTAFYNLFYHYIFPDDINEIVTEALAEAAGKTWDQAATILWESMENIMNREKPKKRNGLLGFLFGKKKGKKYNEKKYNEKKFNEKK